MFTLFCYFFLKFESCSRRRCPNHFAKPISLSSYSLTAVAIPKISVISFYLCHDLPRFLSLPPSVQYRFFIFHKIFYTPLSISAAMSTYFFVGLVVSLYDHQMAVLFSADSCTPWRVGRSVISTYLFAADNTAIWWSNMKLSV